jgi:hypothetical protein
MLEEYCSVECQKKCWPEHKKECNNDNLNERVAGRKIIKELTKMKTFLELVYKFTRILCYIYNN